MAELNDLLADAIKEFAEVSAECGVTPDEAAAALKILLAPKDLKDERERT